MMEANCPQCGHTVSSWTVRCPGCKRRLRYHPLLKFLFFIIVLGAFLGWETKIGTDSSGNTETISRQVVVPLYGPLPPFQEEQPEEQKEKAYEQVAIKRSYGYGFYQQEPIVRR